MHKDEAVKVMKTTYMNFFFRIISGVNIVVYFCSKTSRDEDNRKRN
jgi:hypothetical protein